MRTLTPHEAELLAALEGLGLRTGLIHLTPTKLNKKNPDATIDLRRPLEATGFLSWDALERGEENVRPVLLLSDHGESFVATTFKGYRSKKRGDRRFSIKSWRSLSPGRQPGDMIGVAQRGEGQRAFIVNLSRAQPESVEAIATMMEVPGVPVPGPTERGGTGGAGSRAVQADPAARVAVEQHAVRVVRFLLELDGYEVVELGKPYDLRAVRGSEVVHVEVKGSVAERSGVELTRNEVEDARSHHADGGRILLAVVDRIMLQRTAEGPVATGGELRVWWDRPPVADALFATRFDYVLPGGASRMVL